MTFQELMKKYGDGEINEQTKIEFSHHSDTAHTEEQKLIEFIQEGWIRAFEFDFEISEEKKKVFEYKYCNNNNFRALKDCTIQSLESFTFITNLTWEEFNDRENKKFYLLETREIEI